MLGPRKVAGGFFSFPLHDKSHSIERLAVHLRGGETILFADGQEQAAVAAGGHSTLMAWFNVNAMPPDGGDPAVQSLLYEQMPEHFVWHRKEHAWRRRIRATTGARVIGRLHSVNPSEGPRYYLYMLLLHTRGARSFEDLATVTQVTHFGQHKAKKKEKRGNGVPTPYVYCELFNSISCLLDIRMRAPLLVHPMRIAATAATRVDATYHLYNICRRRQKQIMYAHADICIHVCT